MSVSIIPAGVKLPRPWGGSWLRTCLGGMLIVRKNTLNIYFVWECAIIQEYIAIYPKHGLKCE